MTIERCYVTDEDVKRLQGILGRFESFSAEDANLCKRIGKEHFWVLQLNGHFSKDEDKEFCDSKSYRLCHDYQIPEHLSIYYFLKHGATIFAELPEDAKEVLRQVGKENCLVYEQGWKRGTAFMQTEFFEHQPYRLNPDYKPRQIVVRNVTLSNDRYVVDTEMSPSLANPALHGVLFLHEIFSHKAFAGIQEENPFTGKLMNWTMTRTLCADPACPSNLEISRPSIPRKVRFEIDF